MYKDLGKWRMKQLLVLGMLINVEHNSNRQRSYRIQVQESHKRSTFIHCISSKSGMEMRTLLESRLPRVIAENHVQDCKVGA